MATITYKCPNCGGGLRFDPKLQKFKCDFCLSEFTQEELEKLAPQQAGEQTVTEEEAAYLGLKGKEPSADGKNKEQTGAVLYTCPSCGATVITDETTAATFCYYCHNPIVLEGKLSGKYLPDKLIPFKYDKKKAEEIFLDYVRHKRFVPKAFFTKDQVEKLSGVYYPFWVYNASVDGQMSAAANRIRTWVTGDMEYTETRVFHVERGGQIDIQNLSRNALQESDKNLINAVMPFRLGEAKPFSIGYLQGFVAQKRDIESEQITKEMQERAKRYAEHALERTMEEYSVVTGKQSSFSIKSEQYAYMLLPVWLLTYKALDGAKYYFAMNGQTGEIHGRLPVDMVKLSAFAGALGGSLFVIVLALLYFLM